MDYEGEFDNVQLRDIYKNLNIRINTVPVESPWSNGLVERHDTIIAQGVRKTKEYINFGLDIALTWCLSAKISLQNVHSFSPNQLLFLKN